MTTACIIVNYNDADTTEDLLKSIENYKALDFIIIVDNCSMDNSYDVLKKHESNRVFVLRLEKNEGYGKGNNFGIKYAKKNLQCDIAVIANPDVKFTERCIEKIKSTFEKNDDIAVVTAMQLKPDGTIFTGTAWNIPNIKEYIFSELYVIGKLCSKRKVKDENIPNIVDCVSGAFLAIDIEKFLMAKGYDERIFLYCEETILGIKLKKAGFKTLLLTDENYVHYHAKSTKKSIPKAVKRQSLLIKSKMFVLREYMHASKPELFIAKIAYKISLIEEAMKDIVRSLEKRKIEKENSENEE